MSGHPVDKAGTSSGLTHQSYRQQPRLLAEGPIHGVCNRRSEIIGYGPTWIEYRCQHCGHRWKVARHG